MPFDDIGQGGSGGSARNVLGGALEPCAGGTGFYRDGRCDTAAEDGGCHSVCAVMTEAFLAFTRQHGNDLSTPRPEYDFPGLAPGDRWCLCAGRWQEAFTAGVAPAVVLGATHAATLGHCQLADLQRHAVGAA